MEVDLSVEAIRLKNFMAFEDSGWIELRPITLLFGRNSSGKSAIIRALRLLRQSLDIPSGRGALRFSSPQGIDLGPYWETVHRLPGQDKPQDGESPPRMAFGFRCALPTVLDELWSLLGQYLDNSGEQAPAREYLPKLVEVELVFESTRNDEQARLSEVNISCVIASNGATYTYNVFSALRLGGDDAYAFGEEWWFASDLLISDAESDEGLWSGWGIDTEKSFLPRLVPIVRQVVDRRQPQHGFVDRLLGDIKGQVADFLLRLVHLGPIRPEPSRAYAYGPMDIEALENADWRGFVRLLQGDVDQDAAQRIDAWLVATELAQKLEVKSFGSTENVGVLAQLSLQDLSGLIVNLADVGYGISQVIPVLVECATAKPGDLVIVEQPELHLHSSAQSKLGDLFIEAALRNLLVDWRNKAQSALKASESLPHTPIAYNALPTPAPRFLLETHSEHLLLRLRRRAAETFNFQNNGQNLQSEEQDVPEWPLATDDLRVYFIFKEDGLYSKVVQIGIEHYGELDLSKAPPEFDDFFADDLIELAALARALP